MSEVLPFDPDQCQTIGIRTILIGAFAGLPDVRQVLSKHMLERRAVARAQSETLDSDALLDPEQNAAPFIASGDADTGLIGSISMMELEHSVLWSCTTLLASLHIWSRRRTETS